MQSLSSYEAYSQNKMIAGREPIDYDGGMPETKRLTLRDLLQDPLYRRFFQKPVELNDRLQGLYEKPWTIWILDEGKWVRAKAPTNRTALKWAAKHLREYEDIVISTSLLVKRPIRYRRHYNPPRYKKIKTSGGKVKRVEVLEVVEWDNYPHDHYWCPYCRRPTMFKPFRWHHAFPAKMGPLLQVVPRCEVCGIRFAEASRINERRNYGA